MRAKLIVILSILLVFSLPSVANDQLTFPTKTQRKQIAEQLLSNIETLDAVSIELRNKTRRVTWQEYSAMMTKNIVQSKDWQSLYRSLDNLHYGILNRHSYLMVADSIKSNANKLGHWPRFDLGYTWPQVSFFSTKNNKQLSSFNGQDIHHLFDEFFNLYCNQVHQSGCLDMFAKYIGYGYWFAGPAEQLQVVYLDGSLETVTHVSNKADKNSHDKNCVSYYSTLPLNLVYQSEQACLFSTEQAHIIKLNYFGNWGTSYSDIYCTNSEQSGMCFDIKRIKKHINKEPRKTLVIDLQNNGGGSENTPWIAALTHHGFYDNLVQYKNLDALKQKRIREYAFYFSDKAELWYQNINKSLTSEQAFFSGST